MEGFGHRDREFSSLAGIAKNFQEQVVFLSTLENGQLPLLVLILVLAEPCFAHPGQKQVLVALKVRLLHKHEPELFDVFYADLDLVI